MPFVTGQLNARARGACRKTASLAALGGGRALAALGRVAACAAPGRFVARAAPGRDALARRLALASCVLCLAALGGACEQISRKLSVRPRALRDVPAARLAYRLEPDISPDVLPAPLRDDAAEEPLASVKSHFESSRKEEALLRTVVSPDGQRALALYAPSDPTFPQDEFRVDLYGADGMFVRNVLPPELSGVFMTAVAWSPDGQFIAFTGRRTAKPTPTPSPTPGADAPPAAPAPDAAAADPGAQPTATPTAAPIIAPVQTFTTEQVYVADRDGLNLRPLTARDGLIYFHVAWSPDGRALAALACKQDELERSITNNKQLAGRPRVVDLGGRERLLSDELSEAAPVWSPDAAKIAVASETDVLVFDAAGDQPTAARLPLRDPLAAASAAYDAQVLKQPGRGTPISLNPVVRLEWAQPEVLLAQTGYVRIFQSESEPTRRYLRWHVVHLSPQAVALD